MIKNKAAVFVVGLVFMGLWQASLVKAENTADQNVKIMREAAKRLKHSRASDGYTYMLVKQETLRAPVAVIFGYVDNAAACEEIAEVLTANVLRAGTFKCSPIF